MVLPFNSSKVGLFSQVTLCEIESLSKRTQSLLEYPEYWIPDSSKTTTATN